MKLWIRDRLINILFALLGEPTRLTDQVSQVARGKKSITDIRKKEWQRALAGLWANKPIIDFLLYQAEIDKENAWKGKVPKEVAQGARIRTMFIIYQAQKAHRMRRERPTNHAESKSQIDTAIKNLDSVYKSLVDI